ncbi:hypothetical protein [Humibacter ginsenosidimutans]|uniref:Phage major capsid protein n=1 Tax=Humibacter ginsenosidimutans TaxID=2599293 RepID=A0A5B8M3E3_9MICO|nr:hypothetical protein [Humibacter ginsenosidimutans]QDZ14242.1 hypothetical protein FPZ11_05205 [Humibacter ginsenosidimutans]
MTAPLPAADSVIFDAGQLVIASEDDRIVTGLLLPYGVEGHTNIGGFTVEAATIELPADPDVVTLNVQHDHEQPVGRAVQLDERADGVYASYRIARTAEGDAALADIKSGKRRSLSMEAKGVIVRAGKAVAGRLFGSALVERPAFEGATVLAEYDPEHGIDAARITNLPDGSTLTVGNATTSTTVAEKKEPVDPAGGEETMPEAVVPETVTASAVAPVKSETTKRIEALEAKFEALGGKKKTGITPEQAFTVMASLVRRERVDEKLIEQVFRTPESLFEEARSVYAAQTNVDDPIENQDLSPQWVGEYFGRVKPKPLITDLLNPQTLTSRKVQGYKWSDLPSGASWAGNGAEIHSGAVDAVTIDEIPAQYFAGGNTVSRENFDFGGGPAFLAWYFGQQSLNVQSWLDSLALTALIEGSLDGGTNIIAAPHLAAAVDNTDAQGTLVDAVVAFYTARLEVPDFVLMDSALYTSFLKTKTTDTYGYLSALLGISSGSLEGLTIRPIPTAKMTQAKQATGLVGGAAKGGTNRAVKALAGAKLGADIYTLPGSPFQAETVNVANGQVNVGAYAYGLVKPASDTITAAYSDAFFGVY